MSSATFLASDDTWFDEAAPTTNHGTELSLKVGRDNDLNRSYRSVLKFDLTSLPPGAVVSSAVLRVNVLTTSSVINSLIVIFSRLTTDFSEGTATWETPWTVDGGDVSTPTLTVPYGPQSGVLVDKDITSLVADAVQNRSEVLRIHMRGETESGSNKFITFSSSEVGGILCPTLFVEYTISGASARLPRLCQMYVGDVKQLTATTVRVGPFLNQADSKTRMTAAGLTLGSITCRVVRADNTTTTISLNGSNFVEIGSGWFHLTLSGSHTSTVGTLEIMFDATSQIIPVDNTFRVLSAELYDWLYGASLVLDDLSDALTSIQGGGFVEATDSLEALRGAFDETVAPNVVGSGVSGDGFLSDSVSMIRQLVDEPSVNAKYTDGDILNYWRGSMATVMADINANTDHPVVARIAFPIVVDKRVYALPPQCQKVYYLASFDTATGRKNWEILPGSLWDFSNYGFRIEGSTLRFLTNPTAAETLELAFVPNAEPHPHKGTSETYTEDTFELAATPADGTLDTRPQAYAGYILRITASDDDNAVYTQDRIITSYDNQTRTATVSEEFSPELDGEITYEVIPMYSELLKQVWATHCALTILAAEGASKKYQLLSAIHQQRVRALRLSLQKEFRIGGSFEGRTATNDLNRYGMGVFGRP